MSLLDKERHPRHTDAYSRNLDRFARVRKRKLAIQRTSGTATANSERWESKVKSWRSGSLASAKHAPCHEKAEAATSVPSKGRLAVLAENKLAARWHRAEEADTAPLVAVDDHRTPGTIVDAGYFHAQQFAPESAADHVEGVAVETFLFARSRDRIGARIDLAAQRIF